MSEERAESNALLATTETNVNNPSKSTFTGQVETWMPGAQCFHMPVKVQSVKL